MELTNVTAHKYQTPSIKNLIAALVKVQIVLSETKIKKDIKKSYVDKKGKTHKLEYASFDNIIKVTRPILAAEGLIITQGLAGEFVDTCVNHSSGEQIGYLTNFQPLEIAKNNALQNIGGGFTFIKRYAYTGLLGICAEDENQPQAPEPPKLPLLPKDNYYDAANTLLKDGSLDDILKTYRLTEQQTGAIYILAKGIKEESENRAAEVENLETADA